MIPRSRSMAVLAVVVALSGHAGALTGLETQEPIQIEGGGDVNEAALGAAFEDMSAGTLRPSVAQRVQQPSAEPVQPVQPTTGAEMITTAVSVRQSAPLLPAVAPVAAAPQATAAEMSPLKAVAPQSEITPEAQSEPRPELLTAIRPVSRPTRPEPVQKPKQARPSVAASAGNGSQTAKKGSAAGTRPKGAANARRSTATASTAGNAAASNYAGLVKRKIHRARRKTVNVRGAARVSFRIADSGALAALSITRSSGSGRLDQVALAQVRAAAPFPKPPPGARRQFSVEIKGN